MSTPRRSIDAFVTHDWQTSRWQKYLTLCAAYNAGPAAVAAVVSMCVPLLFDLTPMTIEACQYRLEVGGWEVEVRYSLHLVIGLAVFWLVFFSWQQVLGMLLPSWTMNVFIDKFCIHQTDETLKKEGISSLAGFMRHSNQLVVLWSPRYFTRLWCVYEVAGWLHLGRDFLNSLVFLSVDLNTSMVITLVVICAWMMSVRVVCLFSSVLPIPPIVMVYIVRGAFFLGGLHMSSNFISMFLDLPAQLENFSVRESECFCCNVDHKHPVTGARLPCDRKLVYATLVKWFGLEDGGIPGMQATNEALDAFDLMVRHQVREGFSAMQGRLLPFRVQYKYVLIMSILWLLEWIEAIPAGVVSGPDGRGAASRNESLVVKARLALGVCSYFCFAFPCIFKMLVAAAFVTTRNKMSMPVTLGVVGAVVVIWELLWRTHVAAMGLDTPIPQIVLTGLMVLCTFWSYRSTRRCPVPDAWEIMAPAEASPSHVESIEMQLADQLADRVD